MAMAKDNRFGFTQARLQRLEPPKTGRAWFHDTGCPGLCLCLTANGAKSFYLYRRHNGRPVQYRIDGYPALNVEDARKQARALISKQADGTDIHLVRHAKRTEPTLGDLWDHWWAYAQANKKPKSQVNDKHLWESFLTQWEGRRLASIRQADIRGLHAKIGTENGRYAANRMLSLLGAMYGKSREIGFDGDNPTKGIVRFAETPRDRFLEPTELGAFFKALHSSSLTETMKDFFVVALLTGQRRSNVEGMRWADISFDLRLWRIPGAVTKEGKPIVVPLCDAALEILNRRRETDPTGDWVFSSRSKAGHIVEPKGAWKKLLAQAGLADVRLHDLRRSLGSYQALGGSSLQVIARSLGHGDLRSTAVYSRLTLDPVRESVDAATTKMLSYRPNGNGNQAAVVIDAEVIGPADDSEPTEF
jgi:integrase